MKPLLERLLGRSARNERTADAPSSEPVEAPGAVDSRARVIQALRHQVAEGSKGRLRAHEIREDAQLFDRGYLDSFSYVEFLVFIEQTYRVRIEDSQLAGHLSTIGAMAEHIVRAQAPPE